VTLATQLQVRRRGFAVVAAITLVLGGLLGMRHAAEVAHVRDPHSGDIVHAQALSERHEQDAASHVHGCVVRDHEDSCSLLAAAHATPGARSTTTVARASVTAVVAIPVTAPWLAIAGYRLAPKTSPPARA
jgi:hypothetical protein